MINYTKNKKGFTLVESLVAISILSLSILSTFTVVSSSLKSSSLAKEQVIAFYLAQEAMEYIKNVRDNNALASLNGGANTWLTGLSSAQADPCWYGLGGVGQKTCQITTITQVVTNCAGGLG
ncbi:MAG TPA: prepilin-type N-terminal cleavage/methylation domain-containing protein, partial [Candidatus Paceibacterota bacterium]